MNTGMIALRNLTRQKRRSAFLVGAIAFGVFIVIMVNAFSAGAVRILRENFAEMLGGHVFVSLQQKVGERTVSIIEDDTALIEVLHGLGVRDDQYTRTVDIQQARLVFGSKTEVQSIVGVDWGATPALKDRLGVSDVVFERLRQGQEGIVFSKKVAERLNVNAGEAVLVRGETVTGQQNVGEIPVVYVTSDNSETSALYSFATKSFVNRFLNMPNDRAYSSLTVRVGSVDQAEPFARLLEAGLKTRYSVAPKSAGQPGMSSNVFRMGEGQGEFEGTRAAVTTINEFLSQISQLSTGLQIASFSLLAVLLVITMIGIANTFRMIMHERVREIGTMRAVGMLRARVRRLFLMEALFLSLAGVAAGVILGIVVSRILSAVNFGTESFFALFLQNGHLSFFIRMVDVALIVGLVSLFTLLAALGPARKAARLRPADALRTTY
jgi:putative ABC transport system permease protein